MNYVYIVKRTLPSGIIQYGVGGAYGFTSNKNAAKLYKKAGHVKSYLNQYNHMPYNLSFTLAGVMSQLSIEQIELEFAPKHSFSIEEFQSYYE